MLARLGHNPYGIDPDAVEEAGVPIRVLKQEAQKARELAGDRAVPILWADERLPEAIRAVEEAGFDEVIIFTPVTKNSYKIQQKMVKKVAIVSPYPPPGKKYAYGSGVVAYTKNLIEAFQKLNLSIEFHILADRQHNVPKVYYEGKNIIIHRVYNKNPLYIFQIFNALKKIRPDVVHIQHEYFLYGGTFSAVLFPVLVLLSKLVTRTVILTLHGVIPLRLLNNKEFKKENGIRGPTILLKLGLFLVTKFMIKLSDKIIVHEHYLKNYLINDYKCKHYKITIIPHGVEDLTPLPQVKAKEELKLEPTATVLLYFGYLAGYKGIEELLELYRELAKRIQKSVLIIAGGPHPRLVNESWYRSWLYKLIDKIRDLQREIDNNGQVIFTGYVPEEKIITYYSAADIVILPYRVRIASSGPEALAIGFEKCYVLLNINKEYLNLNKNKYITYILNRITDTTCTDKIRELKKKRIWPNIAKEHLKLYESLVI